MPPTLPKTARAIITVVSPLRAETAPSSAIYTASTVAETAASSTKRPKSNSTATSAAVIIVGVKKKNPAMRMNRLAVFRRAASGTGVSG